MAHHLGLSLMDVEKLPVKEYLSWCNIPTTNEILDCHLSSIVTILNNSNSKKKIKVEDIMLTLTKNDKEERLSNNIKEALSKVAKVTKGK